jgi:DNA invertase Pin-like site-specific DNA recombinase
MEEKCTSHNILFATRLAAYWTGKSETPVSVRNKLVRDLQSSDNDRSERFKRKCIAKQERIRLSERSQAGLARARSWGHRPVKEIVDASRIAHLRSQRHSWHEITEETGISKGTARRTVPSLPKNI